MNALLFESQNYYWTCTCGKKGRILIWHKMVRAMLRHLAEHERKLEWETDQDWVKVGA